ncbi:hypothetical protein SAMN05216436_10176 [bacterium A37T11]|nr:hypothetical protein SAMN05216436_10176 [bacterium A37T11]
MVFLKRHLKAIRRLCNEHNVKQLYAFGSVLTDNFNKSSDVDLVVDFEDMSLENYADNYYDLKFSLEDTLKRPVDLLEAKAIKNPYFKQSLDQQRQLVYG